MHLEAYVRESVYAAILHLQKPPKEQLQTVHIENKYFRKKFIPFYCIIEMCFLLPLYLFLSS